MSLGLAALGGQVSLGMAGLPERCESGRLGCLSGGRGEGTCSRVVVQNQPRVGTRLSLGSGGGSVTLTATRRKTNKPFFRNQVAAASRTKGLCSAKARKGLQTVVFRLEKMLRYLSCAETASVALKY